MGAMHMSLLGPDGITVLSKRVAATTELTKRALSSIEGVELYHPDAYNFRDFVIKLPGDSADAVAFMDSKGVMAGLPLGQWWNDMSSCLLVGCDERTSETDISSLVTVIEDWIKGVN
jgi:glycine dehydrogenase subunit 1